MSFVPKGYVNYHSTCVFTTKSMPKVLLEPHYTRVGVYGLLHVICGELRFYGYADKSAKPEKVVLVKANETAISHPQYWHRFEPLTDDTQFEIHFFAHEGSPLLGEVGLKKT
ncbi:DUF1971 domain-containing protein [uncultured Shewanella sp.]|uniref:DUF1971 domain-containing protein n=1 Tax=uncultured Shewanella sp. TaxID=173975 RepID=UPI0026303CB0|nr:DUF1971 domain-containing protein [uncultured Shewanella sp.]